MKRGMKVDGIIMVPFGFENLRLKPYDLKSSAILLASLALNKNGSEPPKRFEFGVKEGKNSEKWVNWLNWTS